MSNRPKAWMPFYVADYIADTMHLSTVEHGAYMLLIFHYWCTGKPIPDDDTKLARITRLTPEEWLTARVAIEGLFSVHGSAWHHKRIEEELETATDRYERRASAGRKGGKAKAMPEQCSSNAKAMLKQCSSNAKATTPTPTPTTTSTSTGTKTDTDISCNDAEASAPLPPHKRIVWSADAQNFAGVEDGDIQVWQEAYPAVDVRSQLAKARAWVMANPTKRKKNWYRFLAGWMSRCQERGGDTRAERGRELGPDGTPLL